MITILIDTILRKKSCGYLTDKFLFYFNVFFIDIGRSCWSWQSFACFSFNSENIFEKNSSRKWAIYPADYSELFISLFAK